MGLSPMVEDVKPDSEICRLDYDSQLFRFGNILSVVCFISPVIQARAMRFAFPNDGRDASNGTLRKQGTAVLGFLQVGIGSRDEMCYCSGK